MGSYLNPDSTNFQEALSSQIYVDKSGMIAYLNRIIRTKQKYVCVSRPRRFGKSMAVDMLSAYYGCEENTEILFDSLKIAEDPSYKKFINQYEVLHVDMQEFLSQSRSVDHMIAVVQRKLLWELTRKFSEVTYFDDTDLISSMRDIYTEVKHSFIILIDEWDCVFREYKQDKDGQRAYLDFLRAWLKDKPYVALTYMTGILPIKKYGSHSALNMFSEFSMISPKGLAEYVGFTGAEVFALCKEYNVDFNTMKLWYDGYSFADAPSVYSPRSVVEALTWKSFDTYWNQTETYEALKVYIQMNFDGLKDSIVEMLAGGCVKINSRTFSNDMTSFSSRDDVLTLLVHLGYLSYNSKDMTVAIPNREIHAEYMSAIETAGWTEVVKSVKASRQLLEALWNKDEAAVSQGIAQAHMSTSILKYNDENALSYTIGLALYAAKDYYMEVREMPSGKGYADICYIPVDRHSDKPGLIVELKWDSTVIGAIEQIKNKKYIHAFENYHGKLLLVGINYNKSTKVHECIIEDYSIE